jgi:hypothetical protein
VLPGLRACARPHHTPAHHGTTVQCGTAKELMSEMGQKRTLRHARLMSALPPKADISQPGRHVRFVPCVDGSGLARTIFTLQLGSVRPCVRPLSAVHMTAGHIALRGSGPGQKDAFDRCAGTSGLS